MHTSAINYIHTINICRMTSLLNRYANIIDKTLGNSKLNWSSICCLTMCKPSSYWPLHNFLKKIENVYCDVFYYLTFLIWPLENNDNQAPVVLKVNISISTLCSKKKHCFAFLWKILWTYYCASLKKKKYWMESSLSSKKEKGETWVKMSKWKSRLKIILFYRKKIHR